MEDAFEALASIVSADGAAAVFDWLACRYRDAGQYPLLFETRLMQARHSLGLPLIYSGTLDRVPSDCRPEYERRFIEAARETGALFLAAGNIERAWPYFRAIADPAPVSDAIERLSPGPDQESIVAIAFQEGINPRKGFELLLANAGICRAITYFAQYPGANGRDDSLSLLVRTLYHELRGALARTVAAAEGSAPESAGVAELIAGREWLFDNNAYYVDTSHIASLLPYTLDLRDADALRMALEMAEYATHLGEIFQFRGDPPFENIFGDHAIYLRALAGREVEAAVRHFCGNGGQQAAVGLLTRLERYGEALALARQSGCDGEVPELCQLAGNFTTLREVAQTRGNLLHYAAALIATSVPAGMQAGR